MKNRTKQVNIWLYLAAISVVTVIVLEAISSRLINDTSIPSSVDGPFAGLVSFSAVIAFMVCVIASVKVKGWQKIMPILGIVISIVIFGLAFFAFSFSGYGSS